MTTPKEALELKPCPFCGRTNTLAADTGVHWVACNSCDAEGPIRDTEYQAVAAWNTRATASLQGEDAVERVALQGMLRLFDDQGNLTGDFQAIQAATEAGYAALSQTLGAGK